ncbi:LOW QUALITY PROTEIN: zinc transporter 2-like [Dermacentor silvarum]|uniref:LOW QUALITY PROTEIN: zinc transporter 2-like n=1 Tax=Dermacentor silvarum TaxID=543639 RepID=UPI002100D3A3|nr:LOW QUALITY PROTEIN: zinc transporter 2-like [Dermacentor silvarum]
MDVLRAVSSIHCHKNQNDEAADVDLSARRRLICASILCLTFMLFELVGGILANSLAIATDAAHLLTDFASFMISLFSLWMGARPATKRLSFGWYRAEVIGALTSVIMIWAVTGVLVYMAIQRMISKEYNIDATIMLISASVGVVVNIIMGLALQIHPASPLGHSHGSEESARRFELLSTEPFVPHGGTASEMDSSRQCSRVDIFRSVGSRVALGTGSLQAMGPQHVPEVGPSGHSASAPSMSSPPYNPSGPETLSAHHTEGPDAVGTEAVTPHEDATEQRGAQSGVVGPPGSQRVMSTSSEDSGASDFAAIRSGAKRHRASIASASGNVSDSAGGAPRTAAAAAPVDEQSGVSQHDPGTSTDGQARTSDSRHTSAASLVQTPPQQPTGAGTAPAPDAGSLTASPDPPPRSSKESRGVMNINVRAAFIHVLGDLIQSVGVLIAAIVIYFCPSCGVVDPVCTLMFSVIVLVTTLTILREALNVLMEGIPHSVDYHQVKRLLLSVDGVARVHDLHIWALSLDKLAVSAHVVLVPGADAMSVRRSASRTIRRNFDVFKLTLQMEEFEEGIRQHCRRCSEPS